MSYSIPIIFSKSDASSHVHFPHPFPSHPDFSHFTHVRFPVLVPRGSHGVLASSLPLLTQQPYDWHCVQQLLSVRGLGARNMSGFLNGAQLHESSHSNVLEFLCKINPPVMLTTSSVSLLVSSQVMRNSSGPVVLQLHEDEQYALPHCFLNFPFWSKIWQA